MWGHYSREDTNYENVTTSHFLISPPELSLILTVTDCSNGTIAGTSCCTSSNPCGEGEGDCDSDKDCMGNLKCFKICESQGSSFGFTD